MMKIGVFARNIAMADDDRGKWVPMSFAWSPSLSSPIAVTAIRYCFSRIACEIIQTSSWSFKYVQTRDSCEELFIDLMRVMSAAKI